MHCHTQQYPNTTQTSPTIPVTHQLRATTTESGQRKPPYKQPEIWGTAQHEATSRRKSEWGKIQVVDITLIATS